MNSRDGIFCMAMPILKPTIIECAHMVVKLSNNKNKRTDRNLYENCCHAYCLDVLQYS